MTREEAIENRERCLKYLEGCGARANPKSVEAVRMSLDALREQERRSTQVSDGWISVEDRLPDSQADVLVVAFWHECWQTMIGWHSDSGKKWRVTTPHGEREPGGVSHWMPLPEPPK